MFEGTDQNTAERLREMQLRYALRLSFGHDAGDEHHPPSTMTDYHTGGTPWFVVIDPSGQIVHSHFHIDVERAIAVLGGG